MYRRLFNRKLSASSLLEVLTAMAMLLAVLTVSTMVYLRFLANQPSRQLAAAQELAAIAVQAKSRPHLEASRIDLPDRGWYIEQSITPYPGKEQLHMLMLEAFTVQGESLAVHQELIYLEDPAN